MLALLLDLMLEREGSIKTSGVGGVAAMEQPGTSLYLTEVGYKAAGGIQPRAARGEFSQGSAASSLGHVYLVPPWCGHRERAGDGPDGPDIQTIISQQLTGDPNRIASKWR